MNIHGRKTVPAANSAGGDGRKVNGMGTGVVVDERGYIVTNCHVVEGVREIKLAFWPTVCHTLTAWSANP